MNVHEKLKEYFELCKAEALQRAHEDYKGDDIMTIVSDCDLNDSLYLEVAFEIKYYFYPGDYWTAPDAEAEVISYEILQCALGDDFEFDIKELAELYIKKFQS